MVELALACFGAFVLGVIAGGLILFGGVWLGSRASDTGGRFFVPQEENAIEAHEVGEDYFERALLSPDQGGLEFPADFSDEALNELYEKTEGDGKKDFDANRARADQLRGYY